LNLTNEEDIRVIENYMKVINLWTG
jgi:hypothetical protein